MLLTLLERKGATASVATEFSTASLSWHLFGPDKGSSTQQDAEYSWVLYIEILLLLLLVLFSIVLL